MKRLFITIASIFLGLFIDVSLWARVSKKDERAFTLKAYIEEALQKSYELRKTQLDIAIEKAGKRFAANYYIPTLTVSPSVEFDRFQEDAGSRDESIHTELGTNIPLGSSVHLDYDYGRSSPGQTFSTFDPEHSSSLSLGVDQPLLKGFLINDSIVALKTADIDYAIAKKRYEKEKRSLVLTFVEAYWNFYLTQEDERIKEEAYARAREQYERTKEHIAKGILPGREIYLAEESLLIFENSLEEARKKTRDRIDTFLKYILKSDMENSKFDNILLDKPNEYIRIALPKEVLEKKLTQEYIDYRIASLLVDKSSLELRLAKNKTEADLDFNLLLSTTGIDDAYSGSLSDMSTGNIYSTFFGFTFRTPLTYSYLKGQRYSAEKRFERLELERARIKRDMIVLLRDRLREVALREKQYALKKRIASLALKKFDIEEEKYKQGLSTLYDLVLFQRDIANAKSDMNESLVSWHTSIDRVYELVGGLNEKYDLE